MKPVRLLGHSVHPPAVHLPMGLWLATPAWDVLALWSHRPGWWAVSFWCLIGGLAGCLPAVATGFLEYATMAPSPDAERTADRHWMLATAAASLFALSAFLRGGPGAPSAVPLWGLLSSWSGVLVLGAAGWLGGELVTRHGLGREPSA